MRDPETGHLSPSLDLFREVITDVKARIATSNADSKIATRIDGVEDSNLTKQD